jgi:hypothetical protein
LVFGTKPEVITAEFAAEFAAFAAFRFVLALTGLRFAFDDLALE